MAFDIKKVFCSNNPARYYLVANSLMNTNKLVDNSFNNFELVYMLESIISTLYHMLPFSFHHFILNPSISSTETTNLF